MGAKEALEKIKAVELEAEAVVARAKKEALAMLEKANRENTAALATAEKKTEAKIAELQELSDKEVRDEIMRLETETAAGIRMIRKKAARAGDKPLEWIISKLKS